MRTLSDVVARERERERESVCVCVCTRENLRVVFQGEGSSEGLGMSG